MDSSIIQKCKKWILFVICVSRMAFSLFNLVMTVKSRSNDKILTGFWITFGGYGLLFSSFGLYAICKEHYNWIKMYGMLSLMDTIVTSMLALTFFKWQIFVIAAIAGLTSYTAFSYAKYLRNGQQNTIPSVPMTIQTDTNQEECQEHTTTGTTQPE